MISNNENIFLKFIILDFKIYLFCPHFGQNLIVGANGVVHLVHLSSDCCLPQLPQKPLPAGSGLLQLVQEDVSLCNCVLQLTQRFALLSLSVPHFGQAS